MIREFQGSSVGALLLAVLWFADVATAQTAPTGDLDQDGATTISDLQCFVLLFNVYTTGSEADECVTSADCILGGECQLTWGGHTQCLPTCVAPPVSVLPIEGLCSDPDANDADCLGLAPRRLADLNCDGSVSNVDLQFQSWILLGAVGGPDTPDVDGDGRLNFCDDDSDGDGVADLVDCGVLEPTIFGEAPELCDLLDNDCDGLTDTDDVLAAEPCELTEGVCAGTEKPAALCVEGVWGACIDAHYTHAAYEPGTELTCDGLDNDCDGLVDHLDPDTVGLSCCGVAADCPGSFSTPAQCNDLNACQGSRVDATCVDNACLAVEVDDDTACDDQVVADDCGLLVDLKCTGELQQPAPTCPTECQEDGQCDPGAFCDNAVCVPLQANGTGCAGANQCLSGHCQNDFCCDAGDCCDVAASCPGSYAEPVTCIEPATCQGLRKDITCLASICGSTPVNDDSACADGQSAFECGLFADALCTGELSQPTPECADSCVDHLGCTEPGHCIDTICAPDLADGGECDSDAMCVSGHCQNGFCCAAGDCCANASDCDAGTYTSAAVCNEALTCSGTREEPACASSVCVAQAVDDDTACDASVVAFDCGVFGSISCDGSADQSPACPGACVDDSGCIDGFHCDAGECLPDLKNGSACDEPGDCQSGHCQNGYCCSSGDCCKLSADCASYTTPSECLDPPSCQGFAGTPICVSNACSTLPVSDDTACDATVVATDCGLFADLYCTGEKSQAAPSCLTVCEKHSDCDEAEAWCDEGFCVPKRPDGEACVEDAQCQTEHCANGLCCETGDCCNQPSDCPASYTTPPTCDAPVTCQGIRADPTCIIHQCQAIVTDDDTSCDSSTLADDCGPYPDAFCNGFFNQSAPGCASDCADDDGCDEAAHCDAAVCVPDVDNGGACAKDLDCASLHCSGGFCCTEGDCCSEPGDCPAAYTVAPACSDVESCQGTRVDAACTDGQCVAIVSGDDSACLPGLLAADCGAFKAVVCQGGAEQATPSCGTSCTADGECDAEAHCDDSDCVADVADGGACDEPSDCESGHCQNGFCCASGDCCDEATSCPTFGIAPACEDAPTCQGSSTLVTCESSLCTGQVIPDDSGCDGQTAKDCGLYAPALCSAAVDQTAPDCATSCGAHEDCAATAYCAGGECVPDEPDGTGCTADAQCQSEHCSAGICCASGDCCTTETDCPASYTVPAACDDLATCQGHHGVAACVANVCGTTDVDDDTGCTTETVADDCGLFAPVFCSGQAEQTSVPSCASSCSGDSDCTDGLFCTGEETCSGGACVAGTAPAIDDGVSCTADSCDEDADQVLHVATDAQCDDGLFCNGAESCHPQLDCQSGTAPQTSDGVACTVDACDEETDTVTHTATDSLCDDGQFCTGTETCDATFGCQVNPLAGLDDGVPCTVDACDEDSDTVTHTADDTVCNDGLFCTNDFCHQTLGCFNSVNSGQCLIGGVCYLLGAANLANQCERCDPTVNQIDWTLQAPTAEVCNGIDDDCDLQVDEDAAGKPLTQACANACGGAGTETCATGAYIACDAPVLDELCEDGADNDCDGTTDESACFIEKPKVEAAELTLTTTLGQPVWPIVPLGDGKYTARVEDLANPNTSGLVTASSYAVTSQDRPVAIVGRPAFHYDVVVARPSMHFTQSKTRVTIHVTDCCEQPPQTGTLVEANFVGLPSGPTLQTCTTDATGVCTIDYEPPPEAFDTGGSLVASVTVGSLPAVVRPLTVVKKPGPLVLSTGGCGLELPQHPLFPDDSFTVPVTLNTGTAEVASYDIRVLFPNLLLEVTGIAAGGCEAFSVPTSNIAGNANASGELKFNATSGQVGAACATGSDVHVATITFKARPALTDGVVANVTAQALGVFDPSLLPIAENAVCTLLDQSGVSASGEVKTTPLTVAGIVARVPDAQLLYWQPLTGVADSTQLMVTGIRNDFSLVELAAASTYSTSAEGTASAGASGLITAGSTPGVAIVTAHYGGFYSAVNVRTLTPLVGPGELDVSLTDGQLNSVAGAGGAIQESRIRSVVTWHDGTAAVFKQDVTDELIYETTAAVAYDEATDVLSSSTNGVHIVTVKGQAGNVLRFRGLQVDTATEATCTSLVLVPACEVVLAELDPTYPTAALGETTATITVNSFLATYLQTCQLQVYAEFDDGTRMRVTGRPDVTVTSADPLVFESTPGGLLTAIGDGQADATAVWSVGGQPVCEGTTPIKTKLPKAIGFEVTPVTSQIAIDGTDSAATVKGLPTSVQLKVLVLYEDGSQIDFTDHPTTVYDDAILDPLGVVKATSGGLVDATGAGPGSAQLRVSVGQYPSIPPIEPAVIVVEGAQLTTEIYEPYTPTPPRVADHIFEFMEGTGQFQNGSFSAMLTFSDGSVADVTNDAGLTIETLVPGTETADGGVVTLTQDPSLVEALAAGTVDIRFGHTGFVSTIAGFEVKSEPMGIAALIPQLPAGYGTTLSAIKDSQAVTIQTYAVFNDGTRRKLWGGAAVSGLLAYSSTVTDAATVNAAGDASVHANRSTVLQVDIVDGVDTAPAFDPPAELAVDCNLLPDVGDLDLGDKVGLAHKDRAPGATFTMPARVNTGSFALGAFDAAVTYDPTILKAVSVAAGADVTDAVFNSNVAGSPGTVLFNGSLPIAGKARKGPGIEVAVITFEALKPSGATVTAIEGTVESIVALDTVQPIGPATPRPLVAGMGDLDPECSADLTGDLDGSCAVDGADLRRLQAMLAGTRAPTPEADLDASGALDARDLLILRSLAQP